MVQDLYRHLNSIEPCARGEGRLAVRVLFLTPYPTEGASNRYRVEQYVPYLEREGIEGRVRPFMTQRFYRLWGTPGRKWLKLVHFLYCTIRRLFDLVRSWHYDLVFVHREAYPMGPPIIEYLLHWMGRPLVYDFDDAIFLKSPFAASSFLERFKGPKKVGQVCKISRHVIVGNDYLASYAKQFNPNVTVVPTPIDATQYRPIEKRREGHTVVIGWIGSRTTQVFLKELAPVFRILSEKYPEVVFNIIGGEMALSDVPTVRNYAWSLQSEIDDIQGFDIGVMPLPDNEWTRGKCGFKLIQYMGVGVPAVCSPTGVNTDIIRDGENGFIAKDQEEWVQKLSALVEDPALRKEMGDRGRQVVQQRFSLQLYVPTLVELLRQTAKGRIEHGLDLRPETLDDFQEQEEVDIDPRLLQHQDIICFSSIDWDFIWQGHQEIMSTLAKNGNRVLFVENTGIRRATVKDLPRLRSRIKNWWRGVKGIRKETENLYILSPLLLPFPYSRAMTIINKWFLLRILNRWIRSMGFGDPIIWTFLPTPLVLSTVEDLPCRMLLYYCIDSFAESSRMAQKVTKYEEKMLRAADLVFVTSRQLMETCAKHNLNVHMFPFAVNIERFARVRDGLDPSPMPDDLQGLEGPIIGYVGGIHKWVDMAHVEATAKANPQANVVMVGPIQVAEESLPRLPNIHWLGQKPHEMVPHYVNGFDVALIPYRLVEYTRNVYPTKLNEYLAIGKPVVATPLPEIERFNEAFNGVVALAETPDEFGQKVADALRGTGENSEVRLNRIAAAEENTWSKTILSMSTLIRKVLLKKRQTEHFTWYQALQEGYRRSTRIAVLAVSLTLVLFYGIFRTPVVWWLAEPLALRQPPKKADAIVVLGGGVGETGVFGESTFERTRFGVKLYDEGYAPYLVFSTGYSYEYKEANAMMLLATSLQVPGSQVIIEDRSRGTYQNVRYVVEILHQRGIDEIILVSAPYHMLRCRLLFSRYPDISVTYSPSTSAFYSAYEGGITLRQIRSLFWEVGAIIYYKYKGYF
jgi:glycosyltransferase involved in cell wall biosynthesis/uncharacterized SAM-binding protein YcdF (DUF218 family)